MILLDVLTYSYKKLLIISSSLVVFSFIGLRYKLGVDWQFYYDIFYGVKSELTIEPGYQVVSWISSNLLNFWVFVSLITLLSIFSISRFAYRFSPYPVLVFGCYFIISFGFNVEALRQIIAVAFFYLGLYKYFKNRKHFFYLYCIVGSFFHISLLPLVFITLFFNDLFLKFGGKLFLLGVFLAIFHIYPVKEIIELFNSLIGGPYLAKLNWYALQGAENNTLTFNMMFKVLIYGYFYYNRGKIMSYCVERNLSDKFIKCLHAMYLVMLLLNVYFLPFGTIVSRYDEYFILVMLICFSYSLKVNSFYTNRVIIGTVFTALISVIFIRFMTNDYFRAQYVPYANSIYQLLTASTDDAARAKAVYLHWKQSNQ
ncbi:EpsG family protein [Pantoea sp. JK]|uniref:EpsG family protein n=1 Tax=Pantoea sp. JK TaxID=2871703 RepID=UPI0022389B42|nr:EpsG family protein [Pantoea sp. JK]